MPTFYIGHRPVLRGRNGNVVNTYTGKVGVYSNWDLMNTSGVLQGAPDNDHVPGEGRSPHGLAWSRWFRGLDTPGKELKDSGILHPDIYSGRYPIYEFRGLTGAKVFPVGFGHVPGAGPSVDYRDLGYDYLGVGTKKSRPLRTVSLGHLERYPGTDPNAPASFGAFEPYLYKGATKQPLDSATMGHVAYAVRTDPVNETDHYGFEHTREWFGVPSSKAL